MSELLQSIEVERLRECLPDPATRRSLRKRCGLTQAQVADAVGVDRSAIAKYESGERMPRGMHALFYMDVLDALAGALDDMSGLNGKSK